MGTERRLFHFVGPVLACAYFAVGLFALGWSPALILLGFWLEEILTFVAFGVESVILKRRYGGEGLGAGFAVTFLFPLLHLIFILVFMFMDSSDNEATDHLLDALKHIVSGEIGYADDATLLALFELVAGLVVWQVVAFVRWRKRCGKDRERDDAELGVRFKLALTLPHLTIIAGGFALMILELGTWMAAGILIAKAIGELLLGPALRREMEKKSAQKTSP